MLGCVDSQCSCTSGHYLCCSEAGEDGLGLFEGQLYPVFSAIQKKARLPIKINMGGSKGECFIRIQFECLSSSKPNYHMVFGVYSHITWKCLGG